MHYTVLIPARLASTRLPNKPLADIAGIPMVVRVAQRVALGTHGARVVVAGDSPLIVAACEAHDVESVLTHQDHPSGSDRLAQACELLGLHEHEIVVNVQGDEPLIDPALVHAVAQLLQHNESVSMSTAAHEIADVAEFNNPNVVKVVLDAQGCALYFSRAPIPWWRDGSTPGLAQLPTPRPLRHIGIYGYRVGFLRQFPKMAPSPLELLESLEQLRALWHGHRIAVHLSPQAAGPGVDTTQDLERVRRLFGA
ncbi:MAG: 3-deoxy-manno-octulosonate cytidylyltransferase [Betaproteobacteria bacterium]